MEDLPDDLWLTIWIPLSGPSDPDDELSQYGDLVEFLDQKLQEGELGGYDGAVVDLPPPGMLRPGYARLMFFETSEDARRTTIDLVLDALRQRKLDQLAIVGRSGFVTRAGNSRRVDEVVWPPDFRGNSRDEERE